MKPKGALWIGVFAGGVSILLLLPPFLGVYRESLTFLEGIGEPFSKSMELVILASGAGLLSLFYGRKGLTLVSGGAGAALGILSLLESTRVLDLSMDLLDQSLSGSLRIMILSPFILTGFSLLFMGWKNPSRYK